MRRTLGVAAVVVTLVHTACGSGSGSTDASSTTSTTAPSADFGFDEVVDALTATGATVEGTGPAWGFPFSVERQRLTADGYDLSVYEYPDVATREEEAATILMEGWSVNHTPVEWIGTPHYWIRSRVIVMYLGDEQAVIELVTDALGAELDLIEGDG